MLISNLSFPQQRPRFVIAPMPLLTFALAAFFGFASVAPALTAPDPNSKDDVPTYSATPT